jgi:hypothetical protein
MASVICQVKDCPNRATHATELDLDGDYTQDDIHTIVRIGPQRVQVCDDHDLSQAALDTFAVQADEWNPDYTERTVREIHRRPNRIKLDGYADDQGSKRAVPA